MGRITTPVVARIAALAIAAGLSACSPHDVAYYKNDAGERAHKMRECLTDDPDSQECRNAAQAEFDIRGIPARNGRALPNS